MCGHYDDSTEDEFRMNTNELTQDIKKFHRSFSLQNDEDCLNQDFENFYTKSKFSLKDEKKTEKYQKQQQIRNELENIKSNMRLIFYIKNFYFEQI